MRLLVERGRGLHLDGVVAVAQLGEAEATHLGHLVDSLQQVLVVPLRAQLEDGAAEEVELHGHLGAHGGVDDGQLVGGEDAEGVVAEVEHGDEASAADGLEKCTYSTMQ